MKCIVRLKVTDGLTQSQQIYVLSNIITQVTFFQREHRESLITKFELQQAPAQPYWQVTLYFDNDNLNAITHIFASDRFNILNGNIYSFDYALD